MTIARPWPTPTATAKPPAKLGTLILAAISAACEEEKAKEAYRAGRASRSAIDVTAKQAIAAENAMWRRLREVCPEEVGEVAS